MNISFDKNAEPNAAGAAPSAPVIDVQSTVVPTPDPAVNVTTTTTVAAAVPAADVTPVAAIPTAPAPLAVAAPEAAKELSKHNPTSFDEEDIGYEDIKVPRLNIVQKVGDLSNVFEGGELILDQTVPIHTPAFIHPSDPSKNTPGTGLLNIVILGFRRRQFVEKVGGGKMGMMLNSEEDVAAKGGTLDYNEWKDSIKSAEAGGPPAKKYFEKLATALILIEKPSSVTDADNVIFPYEVEGKFYALALWGMKGISYTNGAKAFFTARKSAKTAFRIKNPTLPDSTRYSDNIWAITTRMKDYFGNFAYHPVVRTNGKTSDALRGLCDAILG